MSLTDKPLILTFNNDLMFGSKIQTAAVGLGFDIEFIDSPVKLGGSGRNVRVNEPGEPVYGQDADVFNAIVDRQPAMLIFDLAHTGVPWRKWIPILKSSPATRRIPIVCYAPHVDNELRQTAKGRGADVVVPRSRFSNDLPKIIDKFARRPDTEALLAACEMPLSDHALRGLELFNEGEYFECHEELEDAWMDDDTAARNLYKGVLQVAVAYMQIERDNFNGAVKMLMRVRQWLDPLPDECRGIDIAQLRYDALAVHGELLSLGRENLDRFDKTLLKPVRYKQPE